MTERNLEDPTTRNRLFAQSLKAGPSTFTSARNTSLERSTAVRGRIRPQSPEFIKEEPGLSSSEEESSESDESELPDAPYQTEYTLLSDSEDEMADLLFDGKDPSALPEFLRVAEATFKLHDKFNNNEERKAAYIIAKIRYPASVWLEQAIEADGTNETDYQTLKTSLKQRYEPSANEAENRAKDIIMRIQQKGTVEAYDTYFESTWARSGLESAPEKARLFLSGLYPSIRRYIRQREDYRGDRTKEWLKEKAIQYQDSQEPRTPQRGGGRYRDTEFPRTPGTGARDKSRDTCFKCGRTGHWSSECRSGTQNRQQSYTPIRDSVERSQTVRGSTRAPTQTPFGDRPW